MSNLRGVGREAEDRAAEYLIEKGYTIVTRRFKTRRGELDIVAMDGETLVFVEVKSRRAPGYSPEEAVSRSKLAALGTAMQIYVSTMDIWPIDTRLDLIAIDRDGIRHHKNLLAP
jgi:putative endonuclease